MKTKKLYVLTAVNTQGEVLFQKMVLAFLALILLFASLPVTSVFAAPASQDKPWENADLEREWNNKLRNLRVEGLFFNQVRFYPADFEDSSDLARAWDLLHQHGAALRQANTIVFNHAGFDFEANVLNERQAYESVHDLGEALRLMRVARMKIAQEGYKIQRVR
jgi:hypothetical protein